MGEDRPLGWISVDDLGKIAALVFADPGRFIGTDASLVADIRSIAACRQLWRDVTGRSPGRFPLPVWAFERSVGTDLTTMWRWLRTGDITFDPSVTRDILPTASTVREWLQ